MASEAPAAVAAGAASLQQVSALRGVMRELSSLAAQKQLLEAGGCDTTSVVRQITAFRTVVIGLQTALVPKPVAASAPAAGTMASPRAGAAPGAAPSAAAARFLAAMEELRVAEAQLEQSQECDARGTPHAELPASTHAAGPPPAAAGAQVASPVAAAVPEGEAKHGAARPSSARLWGERALLWTAPGEPFRPAGVADAPASPPVGAAASDAAPSPVNSRAVAAQKARLERKAAFLAEQLVAAREEAAPPDDAAVPVEVAEAEGADAGAAAAVSPVASPEARSPKAGTGDVAAPSKVELLEAEIASLQSEIARLTTCSWLDTSALATAVSTDVSALISSVHAWAAQSTQAALEEALKSTQRALEAAAESVPTMPALPELPSLEAPSMSVPSPLVAIADLLAAEFARALQALSLLLSFPLLLLTRTSPSPPAFSTVKRDAPEAAQQVPPAAAAPGDSEEQPSAADEEPQLVRAALPPAARPPVPKMSPPFRLRPAWSDPPPIPAAPAVLLPADLLASLPPELSAQLQRAAEEIARPLDDPRDWASEMRRETEERRCRQLAAARAAAAAAPPPEEFDSMDAGGVM